MTTPQPAVCDVLIGDNRDVLPELPGGSMDLAIMSPPYASLRRETAIRPNRYVECFLPVAWELRRVLRPAGSFVLNIAPVVVDGEEHPFVDDLVAALRREVGFRLVQRYIWAKPGAMPGDFGKRAKPAWEYIFHFAKTRDYWWDDAEIRTSYQSKRHLGKPKSHLRNPDGLNRDFYGRGNALPPNYFTWPTARARDGAGKHSAVFPIELPGWFVLACCPTGGVVLDPFAGYGTTGVAALALGRRAILVEKNPAYEGLIHDRLSEADYPRIAARIRDAAARGPRL